MNDFIDELITVYKDRPKRRQIMKKEIEDFMCFFYAITEDDKYKHMRVIGLAFIEKNKHQIFKKIREAVPNIHNRSKSYQSILSSEEIGFGRRRSRRLV
tara:strand:- start:53 stop:349 length:297 start_codon:yes stop_codon:yes gene_type:complete